VALSIKVDEQMAFRGQEDGVIMSTIKPSSNDRVYQDFLRDVKALVRQHRASLARSLYLDAVLWG
jgi:hypothetical protein